MDILTNVGIIDFDGEEHVHFFGFIPSIGHAGLESDSGKVTKKSKKSENFPETSTYFNALMFEEMPESR